MSKDFLPRTVEPELMSEMDQARAYAAADFEEPHQGCVQRFLTSYPDRPEIGMVLDLGCGPADITVRFAEACPGYEFDAVDGSLAMLQCARERIHRHPGLADRIHLIEGRFGEVRLPRARYDLILSNNVLHHLHHPEVLWDVIKNHSSRDTLVYLTDLTRPASSEAAQALVEQYAANESPVLKRDFYHSLLAAFTPGEVEQQLKTAGLESLVVEVISDRHLVVSGRLEAMG